MGEGALGKKHWIKRGEKGRNRGDFEVRNAFGQPKQPQQRERRHHQHGGTGHLRRVASQFPAKCKIRHNQRRVRVRKGGLGNQAASEQQVTRGRNVVAGFIPEVGQAQQGRVRQKQHH